ncbi:alpha/beta fold hydrolase [Maliponia aquimaris]|uniref:Haloacetate dehalogenase H-1 n=1 Tax=Maliponia aquimaris TaxID=1673631 RepID=A0A238K6I1_9RHOB|nr:alpha/beta hydrolase [Maliponia aquimaris]SMX37712.1 Haloacetate dehalogenase H-1 [Maliponia aquimaris]
MSIPRNDIPGFTPARAAPDGIGIAYEHGGSGPPLLLLHGFPQTRAMWAEVAPELARYFTVICPDLRGYGESAKPSGVENYSFRAMARDMLALMQGLGFDRFHLAGHDRGARTAHRLALDAPEAVLSLTVMDIVPTHLLLTQLTYSVARAYYHWFYMAQPEPFPERMIAADPEAYYTSCLLGFGKATLDDFKPAQLAAYRAAWGDPDCRRAMCDDYRAAIEIDVHHDAEDLARRVTCPALVLYGAVGAMARAYDVPATWADRLSDMRAEAIPGGHFFIDQSPGATVRALRGFLSV